MRKSIVRQTLHVCVATDTQRIHSLVAKVTQRMKSM